MGQHALSLERGKCGHRLKTALDVHIFPRISLAAGTANCYWRWWGKTWSEIKADGPREKHSCQADRATDRVLEIIFVEMFQQKENAEQNKTFLNFISRHHAKFCSVLFFCLKAKRGAREKKNGEKLFDRRVGQFSTLAQVWTALGSRGIEGLWRLLLWQTASLSGPANNLFFPHLHFNLFSISIPISIPSLGGIISATV